MYNILLTTYILILKISLFNTSSGQLECVDGNNRRGLCIPYKECKTFVEIRQKSFLYETDMTFIKASECGRDVNRNSYICCADEVKEEPITVSKIAQESNEFLNDDVDFAQRVPYTTFTEWSPTTSPMLPTQVELVTPKEFFQCTPSVQSSESLKDAESTQSALLNPRPGFSENYQSIESTVPILPTEQLQSEEHAQSIGCTQSAQPKESEKSTQFTQFETFTHLPLSTPLPQSPQSTQTTESTQPTWQVLYVQSVPPTPSAALAQSLESTQSALSTEFTLSTQSTSVTQSTISTQIVQYEESKNSTQPTQFEFFTHLPLSAPLSPSPQSTQTTESTQSTWNVSYVQSVQPTPFATLAQNLESTQSGLPTEFKLSTQSTSVTQSTIATQTVEYTESKNSTQPTQLESSTHLPSSTTSSQPSPPTKTTESTQSTPISQSTPSAQPQQSTQSVQPIQPTKLLQSSESTQSKQLTDFKLSTQSTPITQSTPAAQPQQSTQSVQPIQPTKLLQSSESTQSKQLTNFKLSTQSTPITQSTPSTQSQQSTQSAQPTQTTKLLQSSESTQSKQLPEFTLSTQTTPITQSTPSTQSQQSAHPTKSKKLTQSTQLEPSTHLPSSTTSPRTPQSNISRGLRPFIDTGNNQLPLPPKCGVDVLRMKIVGGDFADIDEFPWTALLEYNSRDGRPISCGGTLINQRYVLTAAHCVTDYAQNQKGHLIGVRLGEYNTTTDPDCIYDDCADPVLKVGIEEVIVHEHFRDNLRHGHHDIALLRLNTSVQTSRTVKPICLPSSMNFTMSETGTSVFTAGWGQTLEGAQSTVKRTLSLQIFDMYTCWRQYKLKRVNIEPGQLCAGGVENEDACKGDSGGPLMRLIGRFWILEGIVSLGFRCGEKGWPGIYTRVKSYENWITENMRP